MFERIPKTPERFLVREEKMKAIVYESFGAAPKLINVADPTPAPHGVVVQVMATGVCRSDWTQRRLRTASWSR